MLAPIGAVIGIGLLAFMGFMLRGNMDDTSVLGSQLEAIEGRIAQEQNEIAASKEQVTQLEVEIGPVEATANIFETTFTSLEQGRERADADMSNIVSLLGGDVDLAEVHYGEASVVVNGIASGEDDIFIYAKNLKKGFSSVIISSIKAEEDPEKLGEIIGYEFEFLLE